MFKISKADFRKNANKMVMMAGVLAGFTPTEKDDAFVALMSALINDPEQFDALCNLLGIV